MSGAIAITKLAGNELEVARLRRRARKRCERPVTPVGRRFPVTCREAYADDSALCAPCAAARRLWIEVGE